MNAPPRLYPVSRAFGPPDVIVASMPTIELAYAAVRYGKLHNVPVVADVRDLWPDVITHAMPFGRVLAKPVTLPLQGLLAHALRDATAITGTSRNFVAWGCRGARREPGPWDRAFPLGFEAREVPVEAVDEAGESMRRTAGLKPELHVGIFTGAFSSIMDVPCLIEGARLLWEQGRRDFQIVLAGRGQFDAAWRAQARGVPNVTFVGWQDAAGLAYLGRVASVGIVAQTAVAPPNLPNKVFDYMHAGLPILSNIPGDMADLVRAESCGRTFRAGDARSFAREFASMLQDREELAAMGVRSARLGSLRFSADAVYGEMADLLEEISVARRADASSWRRASTPRPLGRSSAIDQRAVAQSLARTTMYVDAGCCGRSVGPLRKREVSFAALTERPGLRMSRPQVAMALCRYDMARRLMTGTCVLELACGSAFGLDYLRRTGSLIAIGIDIEFDTLLAASTRYPKVPLVRADACDLPFTTASFDTILMLEAIYYVADHRKLLGECRRVLRPNGRVVLSLPNRDASGFHASPLSTHYPNVQELVTLLDESGFRSHSIFGGFSGTNARAAERAIFHATRLAELLRVVPQTLEGRARLKRLVMGRLIRFEELRPASANYPSPVEITRSESSSQFRVLYAVSTRS
ncbi:MAG: methyltransferase domain-containing protein [Mycobacteriales bacterium]